MARTASKTPALRYHKQTRRYYIFTGGKRVYLGSHKGTAANRRLEIVASIIEGKPAPVAIASASGGTTLARALADFRLWALTHYTDSRAIARFDAVIAAAIAEHGETPADQFDGQGVEDIRNALTNRKPELARGYINCLIRALKTAFAWMKRRKIVCANTLAEVRQVRALMAGEGGRETTPIPPVEDWVIEATRRECSRTIRAMIDLQRATGMRPGELCRMRRCDLTTLPSEVLPIPGQRRTIKAMEAEGVPIWWYVPARHKNLHRGKMRIVPIGPDGQQILKPFLDRAHDNYIFRPADDLSLARQKALRAGPCYDVRAYHNAIVRAVGRANRVRKQAVERALVPLFVSVPPWSPNQLRHAALEDAADRLDPEHAAAIGGHSASMRALDAYVQATIKKAASAAAKVG